MLKNLLIATGLCCSLSAFADNGNTDPFENDTVADAAHANLMDGVRGLVIRVPANANGEISTSAPVEMRLDRGAMDVSEGTVANVWSASTDVTALPQVNASADGFENDSSTYGFNRWSGRYGNRGYGHGYGHRYYSSYRPTYYYHGSSWNFHTPYHYYRYPTRHCGGYYYYYYPRGWY